MKIPNQGGYKIKSTKTNDLDTTAQFGEDHSYGLDGKVRRGEVVDDTRFDKLIKAWLDGKKFACEVKRQKTSVAPKLAAENYILPFFSKMKIADIDCSTVRSFLGRRIDIR